MNKNFLDARKRPRLLGPAILYLILIGVLLGTIFTFTATHAAGQIRINAGGAAIASFIADTDFTGGATASTHRVIVSSRVNDPVPQAVYRSNRYGNFIYRIAHLTPASSYSVRLYFAETYWKKAGKRIFNVRINGALVLTNFDIVTAAGGADRAVEERFNVTATAAGVIGIQFITVKDNAQVNGIEILSAPTSTPTPPSTVPTPIKVTPTTLALTATSVGVTQAGKGQRLVTFTNKMQQTIWVAASPDNAHPLAATGWVLPAGNSVSINVPDAWNGRFWGRTGCVFDASGYGHCATGDCGGKFQCTGSGAIPATLAEFNLNSYAGLDFYDVSLVDGNNLPMYINNSGGTTPDPISPNGCVAAGCTHNVNQNCPSVLQIKDGGGNVIACNSACNVLRTNQYCCRGANYDSAKKCNPADWPVDYARVFKAAEPFAYSYAFDDATSTLTCKSECSYRITFGISS